jgi:hypothetical protein
MERLANVARYVHSLGIDFYRIPANISPHEDLSSLEDAGDEARALGRLFRQFDIRTCFHATYYCILNSPKSQVLENAIRELRCLRLYDELAGGGTLDHAAQDGLFPIRCRLESGKYECPPELEGIALNAVLARHAADAGPFLSGAAGPEEALGRSTGRAGQRRAAAHVGDSRVWS